MNIVHQIVNNVQLMFIYQYLILLNIYNYVKIMDLFNVFQKNKMMIMKNFVYIPPKIVKQEFKSKNFVQRKFLKIFHSD